MFSCMYVCLFVCISFFILSRGFWPDRSTYNLQILTQHFSSDQLQMIFLVFWWKFCLPNCVFLYDFSINKIGNYKKNYLTSESKQRLKSYIMFAFFQKFSTFWVITKKKKMFKNFNQLFSQTIINTNQ